VGLGVKRFVGEKGGGEESSMLWECFGEKMERLYCYGHKCRVKELASLNSSITQRSFALDT